MPQSHNKSTTNNSIRIHVTVHVQVCESEFPVNEVRRDESNLNVQDS